jgi:hypothetical protein
VRVSGKLPRICFSLRGLPGDFDDGFYPFPRFHHSQIGVCVSDRSILLSASALGRKDFESLRGNSARGSTYISLFKSCICACGSCGAETLTSLGCEWPQY